MMWKAALTVIALGAGATAQETAPALLFDYPANRPTGVQQVSVKTVEGGTIREITYDKAAGGGPSSWTMRWSWRDGDGVAADRYAVV